MAQPLERAAGAADIVLALRYYGLTQAEVRSAIGPSTKPYVARPFLRSIRTVWMGCATLVLQLSDSLTPLGVGQWLHAQNQLLGGERPLKRLAVGRLDEVR